MNQLDGFGVLVTSTKTSVHSIDRLPKNNGYDTPQCSGGELIRARRSADIGRLDAFIAQVEFLPIATTAMRRAAEFWAEARQRGRPTTPDPALDGDVILAAQAATLDQPDVIVATTNAKHLSQFVAAELWSDIA